MKLLAEWFWVDRWMGSSAFLLPIAARGLYREMLSQAWRRGAMLPNDHETIQRACAVTESEWRANWPLVEKFWRVDGESLVNYTQLEVYKEAHGRQERAQVRAQAGAQARHKKVPEDCPPSPSPSPSKEPTPPGRVVKAEPTATEIEATKRMLGRGELPTGTPMKFEHESPRPTARLTPKDLGFQYEPSQYAHQELAWATTRLVETRNLPGGAERRKAAVQLLHDASATPKGLKIETPDLRRVSADWVKITTDRLIEVARDVYGVSDARLFGTPA